MAMRSICNTCSFRNTCNYLREARELECTYVKVSNCGYNEAVLKAVNWLESALNGDNIEGCKDSNKLIEDFKKTMEL